MNPEFLAGLGLIVAILTLGLVIRLGARTRTDTDATTQVAQQVRDELRLARSEHEIAARALREEIGKTQQAMLDAILKTNQTLTQSNAEALQKQEERFESLRKTLEEKLRQLQEGNEKKLEQMRETVDEKLQSTLEKRLGESFKLVSERLEAVHKGLGDMQQLASGVGDLKRVLTNVKTRGTWGEYQLGDILEQMLTPDQYEKNAKPVPGSDAMVEFAIKLPGRDAQESTVYLPIDAKFPMEDYHRLVDAAEQGNTEDVEKAHKQLIRGVRSMAEDISKKYLAPPHTTDFGILFLPIEGLFAEVARTPGLMEELQQRYRVNITGPTTLSATLNSLRMGFRTLAIEQRSSEVWKVLSAVKTEFSKFEDVLSKVHKKLNEASKTIEDTGTRRLRAMDRKLRDVEKMSEDNAANMLGLDLSSEEEDNT
jgi:DNA recombination protein RmuC